MYNLQVFRHIIYALKQRQGIKVTLHHVVANDFDADTGNQEIELSSKTVYKAIVGSEEILRAFGPNLGADYGGAVDFNKRLILIDKFDLPRDFVFNRNDQVEVGDEQWRVNKLHNISNIAYLIEAESAEDG